jgi:hypothetical protein
MTANYYKIGMRHGVKSSCFSLLQREPTLTDEATIVKEKESPAQNYRFVIDISYGCRIGGFHLFS